MGYFQPRHPLFRARLIALTSAGQIGKGTEGIFTTIENFPAGTLVLWVMVVGLLAYALFRFASTFFDIENHGSDSKGWAKRIGHAGSAIGHLVLAWSAYQFATAGGDSGDGGAGSCGWYPDDDLRADWSLAFLALRFSSRRSSKRRRAGPRIHAAHQWARHHHRHACSVGSATSRARWFSS